MEKTTGETPSSTSYTSENYLTRQENVATVHKPEGIYTIIYGSHILSGKGKLPDKTAGVFLESLEAGNSTEINRRLNDVALNNPGTQYKEFINFFRDRRIPVYSGDVNFESLIILPVEVLEEAAKTVIGIELLHKISKELKSKSVSRRSFLKGAVASWLVLPFIARTGRVISAQTNHFENETATLEKASNKVSPEDFLFTEGIREAILAHKEVWIAQSIGNRPELVTVIGSQHVGLEEKLRTSAEDRLTFLKATKPLWSKLIDPESFYKVERRDFNGMEWQEGIVYEVPDLKQLATT